MRHYNDSLTENFNRIFNVKGSDSFDDVAEYVQPVVNIEPKTDIIRSATSTVSGAFAIYTAPSDKDFYITAITAGISKDVTCDAANGYFSVNMIINGVTREMAHLPFNTLTAMNSQISLSLPNPIKVDRGTAISGKTITVTAGVLVRTACVYGYQVETTKGI